MLWRKYKATSFTDRVSAYIHRFQNLKMHQQAARFTLKIQLFRLHKSSLTPLSLISKYLEHYVFLLPDPCSVRIRPLPWSTMKDKAEVLISMYNIIAYPLDHCMVSYVCSSTVEANIHIVEFRNT